MERALTILICTHNRAALLKRMLSSIYAAEQPAGWRIRILVVLNSCTDDTQQMLRDLQLSATGSDRPDLQWADEPRLGKSHALNRGISMVESDWVMFTDDDQRIDGHLLCNITQAVENHPGVHLFCGRLLPDWDGTEPAWVHDTGPYRIYPPPITIFDEGDTEKQLSQNDTIPPGGDLIIERSVLQGVGAFSTEMGPKGHNFVGGEDSDFVLKAMDQGEKLYYIPSIVQYHYVDESRLKLSNLLKLSYQRSRSITKVQQESRRTLPPYMVKKLLNYLIRLLFSWNKTKYRFYLVRLSSTFGEARGILDR